MNKRLPWSYGLMARSYSKTISNVAASHVRDHGYAYLPRVCSPAQLQELMAVAKMRINLVMSELSKKPAGEGLDMGIGSAAGYDEIVQRSPGRYDVPIALDEFRWSGSECAPWWPLVQDLLGDDSQPSFSGVVFSEPNSPAQCWHSDSPHEASEHLPPHALNVLVALEDITQDMGVTEVWAGSHRLTNHLANPQLIVEQLVYQHEGTSPETILQAQEHRSEHHERAISTCASFGEPDSHGVVMEAGSALLFDDRLLHRGLGNHSNKTRNVAYFSYKQGDYNTETYFEAARSVFESDN